MFDNRLFVLSGATCRQFTCVFQGISFTFCLLCAKRLLGYAPHRLNSNSDRFYNLRKTI